MKSGDSQYVKHRGLSEELLIKLDMKNKLGAVKKEAEWKYCVPMLQKQECLGVYTDQLNHG